METTLVTSPTMPDTLYGPGRRERARILAELASRWEAHEPEVSERELAAILNVNRGTLRHHLEGLRDDGIVHRGRVTLTALGYAEARRP